MGSTGYRVPVRSPSSARSCCGAGGVPAGRRSSAPTWSGTVLDQSKAALPGVTVTIRNTATGREQVLVTDAEGRYRAVALQPGPYEVVAELTGFGTAKRAVVTLVVGGDVRADLEMGVATLQETVTVSGTAALIEVTKSAPSTTIVSDQIQALPVLERNFLSLAQMMPGAAPNYTSKFSRVKFGGPADQRNGYTTIVDGGDLDDAIWGDPTVNISQDAVQEFKVFRNQFDAQYGAALAAVVTVVTRSGTNDLSGTGYFFGRDDALNARNAFQRSKPVYEQQRTGGSIGGPIFRNRTHFFGAYEYNHVDNQKIIALPASNPFATRENGEFPAGSREHMAVAKFNHRFTDNTSAFLRYAFDDQWATRTGNPSSDSANVNDSSKMHSLIGEQSWVISNTMVNTLRGHYMWNEVATLPVSFGPGEVRPSVTTGQNFTAPQYFPRTRLQLFETLFMTKGRHDLKMGGDYTYAKHTYDAHFYESGQWQFGTDAAFNADNPATWPFAFVMQTTGVYNYNSHILAAYLQDDWRRHRQAHPQPGPALRPRHQPADERRLRAGAAGSAVRRPRELRQRRPRQRLQQPPAAARRHLRHQRPGHAGRPRRLGHVRHPAPPLLRADRAGPAARRRRAHRGSRPAAQLPEHRRRARRQVARGLRAERRRPLALRHPRRLRAAAVAEHHRRHRLADQRATPASTSTTCTPTATTSSAPSTSTCRPTAGSAPSIRGRCPSSPR